MIGTLTQVAKAKLSAVLLGTTGVGTLNQLTNLWTLLSTLATMGLYSGIVRHLSGSWRDEQRAEFSRHLTSNMLVMMAFAIILSLLGCIFSAELSDWILDDGGASAEYICLILIGVPLYVAGQCYRAMLNATRSVNSLVRARIGADILSVVAFAALVFPLGLKGAVIAYVALHLFYLLLVGFYVLKVLGREIAVPKIDQFELAEVRKNVAFGVNGLVLLSVGTLTNLIVARWIVTANDVSDNGIFAMAIKVGTLFLSGLSAAAGGYYFPTLSASKSLEEMHGHIDHALGLYFYIIPPMIVGLLAGGELMMQVLFSEAFVPAAILLLLILPGDLFRTISETVRLALVARKKLAVSIAAFLAWAALYLGLVALLLPQYSLMGVAAAYLISRVFQAALVILVTWHWLDYRPSMATLIGLLRGIVLVGAMSILTWERPGLVVSIFIGIGLLTGWFAASWLDRNFRELVHKMLANVRSALPF